jgi:hypothetical protein
VRLHSGVLGGRLGGFSRRWRGRSFELGNPLYEARDDFVLAPYLLLEEADAFLQGQNVSVARLSGT